MKLKATKSFSVYGKMVQEGTVFEVDSKMVAIELIKLGRAFAVSDSTPVTQSLKKNEK
jgi:hypothetical protein